MTLHCVYDRAVLRNGSLARALAGDDVVLLLAAAVTAAHATETLDETVRVFALAEDVAAHGVANLPARVSSVDYSGWVALTVQLPTQQVWA